jgi:hypothetical protein
LGAASSILASKKKFFFWEEKKTKISKPNEPKKRLEGIHPVKTATSHQFN